MISKKTFDDIQEALRSHGKPRHGFRKQKGFLFLNFARCSSCGYSITAERKIKPSGRQYYYYRCTHKNREKPCTERGYTRQEKFESEVKRNVELLSLPDERKENFLSRVAEWSKDLLAKKNEQIEDLKSELSSLKLKIERLNAAFADGNLNVDEFKELKNPLLPKRVEIEEKIVALQTTHGNRLEPLPSWILEANQAAEWAGEKNWVEMKSFLRRVGSNRLLRSQTLRVSYEIPWDFLAETNLAVRRAASVSEVNSLWVEARGVEPLSSLLSTQTSTCLSGVGF